MDDHVLRTNEGSKAILEETLSKTREQTDERSAGAQKLCDEILKNHDAFFYLNKRDNPSRASPTVTCLNRQAIRQKTSIALKLAREVMMKKYEKTKK